MPTKNIPVIATPKTIDAVLNDEKALLVLDAALATSLRQLDDRSHLLACE
jgi:hypothetical protein